MQRLVSESVEEWDRYRSTSSSIHAVDEIPTIKVDTLLNGVFRPDDVLCGRGKVACNHAGNIRFRTAIDNAADMYAASNSKHGRAVIVQSIIDGVKSSGGKFLRKDFHKNKWTELSSSQCREKVHHALRDTANNVNRKKQPDPSNSCTVDYINTSGSAMFTINDKSDHSNSSDTSNCTEHFCDQRLMTSYSAHDKMSSCHGNMWNTMAFAHTGPPALEIAKASELGKIFEPTVLKREKTDSSFILELATLEAVKSSDFSIRLDSPTFEMTPSSDFSMFGDNTVNTNRNISQSPSNKGIAEEDLSHEEFLSEIKAALDPVKASTVTTFFDTLQASMRSLLSSNNDLNFDGWASQDNNNIEVELLSASMMSLCLSTDDNMLDVGNDDGSGTNHGLILQKSDIQDDRKLLD